MNTLQINNLSKTYPNGVKAINGISLKITNGMFGLLGANGAGKSSLMRTIASLQEPSEGSITFNDVDILTDNFGAKITGYLLECRIDILNDTHLVRYNNRFGSLLYRSDESGLFIQGLFQSRNVHSDKNSTQPTGTDCDPGYADLHR